MQIEIYKMAANENALTVVKTVWNCSADSLSVSDKAAKRSSSPP